MFNAIGKSRRVVASLAALGRTRVRPSFASDCCREHAEARARDANDATYTTSHEIVRANGVLNKNGIFKIGIAPRGFELIGDVRRIEPVKASGEFARRGDAVLKAHWTGFARSASDELYHATWANAKGVREVVMPFDGVVVRFNAEALKDAYGAVRGPETWLVEVAASENSARGLLDEKAYREMCEIEEIEEAREANASYP